MATEIFSAALSSTPTATGQVGVGVGSAEIDFFYTVDGASNPVFEPRAQFVEGGTFHPIPTESGGVLSPSSFTEVFGAAGAGILTVPSRGIAMDLLVSDAGATPALVVTSLAREG